MIRVSASLRHRSGAEVLRIDTGPVERAAMRRLLDDAFWAAVRSGSPDDRGRPLLDCLADRTRRAATMSRQSRDKGLRADRVIVAAHVGLKIAILPLAGAHLAGGDPAAVVVVRMTLHFREQACPTLDGFIKKFSDCNKRCASPG
jgi:hypothetical protein